MIKLLVRPEVEVLARLLVRVSGSSRRFFDLQIEGHTASVRRNQKGVVFSYIDRNGDGVGDIADITFHRIVLVDQGIFDGVQLASANHSVLVFADEQIGTNHDKLVAQARLNGIPPVNSFTQAQFTFSGLPGAFDDGTIMRTADE